MAGYISDIVHNWEFIYKWHISWSPLCPNFEKYSLTLCVGWPPRDNCLLWGVSHKMFVLSWRKYLCVHRNIAEIMVGSHRDHQQPGHCGQLRQWPGAPSDVSGVWADHRGWAGQLPSCMIRQKMDHLNKVSLKGPATFLQSLSAGHSIIISTGHYL